ncbi:hypothetical protein AOLI_G00126760 [Acnodon oligacanthus]
MLDKGKDFSTIKVYLAAISACHMGFGDKPVGQHPLVCHFMKGARRKLPVSRPLIPPWDLSLVLDALCSHSFEPLVSVGLKFLSLKTVLLLALTTARRESDLQALSIRPSCLQFDPGYTKVHLCPNPAYVPKIEVFHQHFPPCLGTGRNLFRMTQSERSTVAIKQGRSWVAGRPVCYGQTALFVRDGEEVVLQCFGRVDWLGSEAALIQWKRGWTVLEWAQGSLYVGPQFTDRALLPKERILQDNISLELKNTCHEDQGLYKCLFVKDEAVRVAAHIILTVTDLMACLETPIPTSASTVTESVNRRRWLIIMAPISLFLLVVIIMAETKTPH